MTNNPAYFGPERRKSQRRSEANTARSESLPNRRTGVDRRQEAHKTFVTNMSGEDMELMVELHKKIEARRVGGTATGVVEAMTYEQIIAREA